MASAVAFVESDDVVSPEKRDSLGFAAMPKLSPGEFSIENGFVKFGKPIGEGIPAQIPLKEILVAVLNTSNDDNVIGAINLIWRHLDYGAIHTDFLNFAFKRAAAEDFNSAKSAFKKHAKDSPMRIRETTFSQFEFEVMNMPLLDR